MNALLNTAEKLNARKRKAQQGFTLVEVIVVAVIVAALAGVAIPLYLNYVTNSRINQSSNIAGSAASFLGACVNGGGTTSGTTPATGGGNLACAGGTGAGTTMNLPPDYALTATGLGGTTGTTVAQHVEGGASTQGTQYTY